MSFCPLSSCGRQQGPSAWVRVWKRSSVIGAPHAPTCCTARRQRPAEAAKVLVIIGVPRLMTGDLRLSSDLRGEYQRCLSNNTRPILSQRNWTR